MVLWDSWAFSLGRVSFSAAREHSTIAIIWGNL